MSSSGQADDVDNEIHILSFFLVYKVTDSEMFNFTISSRLENLNMHYTKILLYLRRYSTVFIYYFKVLDAVRQRDKSCNFTLRKVSTIQSDSQSINVTITK